MLAHPFYYAARNDLIITLRTPVSPVIIESKSIHTPTRAGPTATAQKYVLIAVQHNTEGIYH